MTPFSIYCEILPADGKAPPGRMLCCLRNFGVLQPVPACSPPFVFIKGFYWVIQAWSEDLAKRERVLAKAKIIP